MTTPERFAKECREEVKHYRNLAANAKAKGWELSRRSFTKLALDNRQRAFKWAAVNASL